jgi:hypothetical protein
MSDPSTTGTAPAEPAPLHYFGTAMKWCPTRVLCLQSHGPLDANEPPDADIRDLLDERYTVFVELQPGDGSRYGLLLVPGPAGVTVAQVGSYDGCAVRLAYGVPVTREACLALAPNTLWSQELFAWWLTRLVAP